METDEGAGKGTENKARHNIFGNVLFQQRLMCLFPIVTNTPTLSLRSSHVPFLPKTNKNFMHQSYQVNHDLGLK